jgi:hypothetical protein
MTVTPNSDRNPYHLELTDGSHTVGLILCDRDGNANPRAFQRTPIPRSSVKIYTGEQQYSDLEPPWVNAVQEDWGGGSGGDIFEKDGSRYKIGYRADTTRDGVIRGPLEQYARGIRTWIGYWPEVVVAADTTNYAVSRLSEDAGGAEYIASKFVASASFTTAHLWIIAGFVGLGGKSLEATIRSDNSGSPGTVLATASISLDESGSECGGQPRLYRVALAQALTSGTAYWLVLHEGSGTATEYAFFTSVDAALSMVDNAIQATKVSNDGTTWAAGSGSYQGGGMMFRLTDAEDPFKAHFSILKNSLYTALEYFDGGDSKVYINGTAGTATAGASTYLRDANNTDIVDDKWYNALIYLWDGTGSSVYRPILSSATTNRQIGVLSAESFGISPDTTTKYSILDTNLFTEVTGLGSGKRVTDMISANGAIYFALGDGANMRRLRHFWQAAPTSSYYEWGDENAAGTLLEKLSDGRSVQLWLANRSLPATLKRAAPPDCTGTGSVSAPAAGAWTTVTPPGDLEVKITNLVTYGEGFPRMHVLKEDAIIEYVGDDPQELRIAAFKNARDGWNGYAAAVNDVYLYFSFMDRVQRYYSGQIDDIGPDLPANRRGRVVAILAYPGRLYVAIDGGPYNYSTIQVYNGRGWCELWIAPSVGLRILNAFIQPIPGASNPDRLWFSCGSDIVSMPIGIDPLKFSTMIRPYPYFPGCAVESSDYTLGLSELDKLWRSIKAVISSNSEDYQGDLITINFLTNEYGWLPVGYPLNMTNFKSFTNGAADTYIDPAYYYQWTTRRIRFRFCLTGTKLSQSVKMIASVLEGLVTVPHKYQTAITFRLEDNAETLIDGQDSYTDADTKFAQLDTWASSAGTVGLTSHIDLMNNKRVKIDAASVQLLKHETAEINGRRRNRYLCSCVLLEVD